MKTLVIEKNKKVAKAILKAAKKTKEFYGNDVVVDAGRELNIIVRPVKINNVADIIKIMDKVDVVVAKYIGNALKKAAQSKGVLLIEIVQNKDRIILKKINSPQQRLWREA